MPVGIVDTVGGDLPLPIGGGAAVGVPPADVDVLIDRLPFWLAIGQDFPYQRETAPFQREQVDQAPEAGEQTLSGWWTRSQMSFHYGAGLDYLDTLARPQPEDRLRFKTSRNVNVWTPGQVSRLNGTTLARSVVSGEWAQIEVFDDLVYVLSPSKVEWWDGAAWAGFTNSAALGAACSDGEHLYLAYEDGAIYQVPSAAPTGPWNQLYSASATTLPMQLGWVKSRLMLGRGASLYELDTAASSAALPTAKLTHPATGWQWTAFADAPGGILACGYAGLQSCVYSLSLTDVSGTPTLGAAVALIQLPTGETVRSAIGYIGSLLILGTSAGVRVCKFDTFYGTASLGPLSVETEVPVTALAAFGSYVWGGTRVNGETSLIRLDLSAPLDQAGHYAWAPDLVFPDGDWTETVTSIAVADTGRLVIGVTTRGAVFEDETTDASDSAWLQTARIRMATVEDKTWSFIKLRGVYGSIAPIGVSAAYASDPDTWEDLFVTTDSTERVAIQSQTGEWIALRFDLSEGAELASYQVQALPSGQRQRLVQIPVHLFDYEQTRSGLGVGYPGWARDRLADLETLENAGAPIAVAAPALFPDAVLASVERLTFVQTDAPGDRGNGTGGIVTVLLRVVA